MSNKEKMLIILEELEQKYGVKVIYNPNESLPYLAYYDLVNKVIYLSRELEYYYEEAESYGGIEIYLHVLILHEVGHARDDKAFEMATDAQKLANAISQGDTSTASMEELVDAYKDHVMTLEYRAWQIGEGLIKFYDFTLKKYFKKFNQLNIKRYEELLQKQFDK